MSTIGKCGLVFGVPNGRVPPPKQPSAMASTCSVRVSGSNPQKVLFCRSRRLLLQLAVHVGVALQMILVVGLNVVGLQSSESLMFARAASVIPMCVCVALAWGTVVVFVSTRFQLPFQFVVTVA